MTFNECSLMNTFLSALWALVGALVAGSVCFVLGRRSHPVEKAAKRGDTEREYFYRGRGGEPTDFS